MASYRINEGHQPITGAALKAPLRGLSCPSSSRDVAGRRPEQPPYQASSRSPDDRAASRMGNARAARSGDWWEPLATDYWNPPTSGLQRARQRLLAVIVAFMLAAVLAHLGW